MGAEPYRPRRHINRVLGGSKSRHSTRLVLEILCRLAEFDRPEVTVTKPQLRDESGLCANTVRAAMRELREAGTIVPIKNKLGGRGNAVTYRLIAMAEDREPAAAETAEAATVWDAISGHFKDARPDLWKAWLSRMAFASAEGGSLRLVAPNGFVADYCRTHLAGPILDLASSFDSSIRRLDFAAAQ